MIYLLVLRIVIVLTVLVGGNYLVWRWLFSLNWDAWWIAVPLVVAETYSFIDVCLFGLTVWRSRTRPAPPAPVEGLSVDVFVTTYDEAPDLVMTTARAARDIRYPHKTFVLDDGTREDLRRAAEAEGIGYISRGSEWTGFQRHAKAGNINNALIGTEGEFILILDADMIPRPEILDRTLGYFSDEKVALVQTPQVFSNVGDNDPLGSQAPLFYGPIQEGKDGYNAAYFCGSNAVLRRDALMQLGIVGYVQAVDLSISAALRQAARVVREARSHPANANPAVHRALDEVAAAISEARSRLASGAPLAKLTYDLHRRIDKATSSVVAVDLVSLESDLREIESLDRVGRHAAPREPLAFDRDAAHTYLAVRDFSPLNALEEVQASLASIAVDRPGEAQPVMPLATISVTEDIATSMRLHALGWKSVFHDQTLADGLAPEDLGTMLTQRLRWGQGTMQVFLRENPLFQRGLTLTQRLMYFATMWSYLNGFAAVIYFAAPIIFLVLGILPVHSLTIEFFARFIPFVILNQLIFLIAGHGVPTWRGQQYSVALFPVWIASCVTAFNNVVFRIPIRFAVTPKTRRQDAPRQWRLIRPQLVVMTLLVIAIVTGVLNLAFLGAELVGTSVNIAWAIFDLIILSVLFQAVNYRGYVPREEAS